MSKRNNRHNEIAIPRVFAGLAVLAAVWVVVWWSWDPRSKWNFPSDTSLTDPVANTGGADDPRNPTPFDMPDFGTPPPNGRSPIVKPNTQRETNQSRPSNSPAGSGGQAPAETRPEQPGQDRDGTAEPPRFRNYTVQPGDTFTTIARDEMGSARLVSALLAANPLKDPSRLRPGEVIRVPLDPENIQGRGGETAPPPSAERVHTVQAGETLSSISQRYYGSVRYTDFLFNANRDQLRSPDDLRLGQELRVPPLPE